MAKAATKAMPREVRLARVEVEKAVDHLGRSVTDIQQALRRAERTIEADARARISALRKEAKTQLNCCGVSPRSRLMSLSTCLMQTRSIYVSIDKEHAQVSTT